MVYSCGTAYGKITFILYALDTEGHKMRLKVIPSQGQLCNDYWL